MKLVMFVFAVFLAVTCTGCVAPATAEKIDALESRIQNVATRHAAGELTTREAQEQIAPLLAEMKAVRDAEGSWWQKAGYVLLSVGSVVAGRLLGVPGLASSSGANLAAAGKRLMAGD